MSAAAKPTPAPKDEYLTRLFYDPKSGLTSATKLYKKAKAQGYTMKQVREFVSRQEVSQIHQKPAKPTYFPIYSMHDSSWQIDLIFYPKTSKINNGYSVVLLAVEVTTRKLIAVPMKNKTEKESLRAGRAFLKEAAKWKRVAKCTSDLGSEFYSKAWARLMKQHKIVHAMVEEGDHNILGLINRVCRTVKALVTKYFDTYDTKKWIDVLPDLVHNYNSSVHSSIKCTPFEAERSVQIRKRIRDEAVAQTNFVAATKEHFAEGDRVRKLKKGALFGKEGAKWTKGTYTVDARANNFSSYGLNDEGDKNLKHYELKKVPPDTQKNPYKRDTSKSFDVETHLAKARHSKEGVDLPKRAPSTRKAAAPKAHVLNISDQTSKDYAGQAKPAVQAPSKARPKRKAAARKPKGSNVFEIDHLVREISSKGKKLFQVRWKGFDPSKDTFEPEKGLPASVVAEFRKSQTTAKTKAVLAKRAKAAFKRLKNQTFVDEGVTWRIGDAKYDEEYNCVMVYYWDTAKHKKPPPLSKMEFSPLQEVEQLMGQKRRRKRS